MGFLAYLVLKGYIRQAEIAFMMVGHTHEGVARVCPSHSEP